MPRAINLLKHACVINPMYTVYVDWVFSERFNKEDKAIAHAERLAESHGCPLHSSV